jgi:hypothetical protein
MDVDDFNSDASDQYDPRIEGVRLNVERNVSQPGSELSGEQFGIGQGSSFATFESDTIGSDADESDDKEVLLFDDDLDSSSEYDSSERESLPHIQGGAKDKDATMGDSENEFELRDEDYGSVSDDDKGTNTRKT